MEARFIKDYVELDAVMKSTYTFRKIVTAVSLDVPFEKMKEELTEKWLSKGYFFLPKKWKQENRIDALNRRLNVVTNVLAYAGKKTARRLHKELNETN